jgi:hypothetical protein
LSIYRLGLYWRVSDLGGQDFGGGLKGGLRELVDWWRPYLNEILFRQRRSGGHVVSVLTVI